MLPPLGFSEALSRWQWAPVVTAVAVIAAAAYLWGVRRVARRHPARPWPLWRTGMFLGGLLVIVLATESGLGRYDDVLNVAGHRIGTAEVESALADHPDVVDVVVIGLRDPEWGRRVHAVIEPGDTARAPSAKDIIAYAKSRLAAYKVPKTVEFVDEIPRTAATKVNRSAMIEVRGG